MDEVPFSYFQIVGRTLLDCSVVELTQTLDPIDEGGAVVRLADGTPFNLKPAVFRKYSTKVNGSTVFGASIADLWQGALITIHCSESLFLPGDVADADLPRPAVPGSVLRYGQGDAGVPVLLATGDPGVIVTRFRPILDVMVLKVSSSLDEWKATTSWTLEATEV